MTREYLVWFTKVRALLWDTVWVRLRPERGSQGIHADAPDAGCPAARCGRTLSCGVTNW